MPAVDCVLCSHRERDHGQKVWDYFHNISCYLMLCSAVFYDICQSVAESQKVPKEMHDMAPVSVSHLLCTVVSDCELRQSCQLKITLSNIFLSFFPPYSVTDLHYTFCINGSCRFFYHNFF